MVSFSTSSSFFCSLRLYMYVCVLETNKVIWNSVSLIEASIILCVCVCVCVCVYVYYTHLHVSCKS